MDMSARKYETDAFRRYNNGSDHANYQVDAIGEVHMSAQLNKHVMRSKFQVQLNKGLRRSLHNGSMIAHSRLDLPPMPGLKGNGQQAADLMNFPSVG